MPPSIIVLATKPTFFVCFPATDLTFVIGVFRFKFIPVKNSRFIIVKRHNMGTLRSYYQITKGIIRRISIKMMNLFSWEKRPTNGFFNNISVFKYASSIYRKLFVPRLIGASSSLTMHCWKVFKLPFSLGYIKVFLTKVAGNGFTARTIRENTVHIKYNTRK